MGKKRNKNPEEEISAKIRLPRDDEILGVVVEYYGGNQMKVRCKDGVERHCFRKPKTRGGRIREGDVVLVKPWIYTPSKADVIVKYRPIEVEWLIKNGYLTEDDIKI